MRIKNLEFGKKTVAGLLIAALLALPGCSKKSDCEINGYHLHRYEKAGIVRYLDEEELHYKGYDWTNNVVYIESKDQKLYDFEEKKGLIRIEDNVEYLQDLQESNTDYMEYRYAYTYLQPFPISHSTGKFTYTTFMYIPVTHYSWTTDPNHSRLTGQTRICHHVYTGYKVVEENGKYKVVESPQVDDIFSISEEYPYFKEKVCKIVNRDSLEELDYEDGPEEEQEKVQEEQAKSYQKTK